MTLPHPHGTGAGQIGNGATIDTGETPGSDGGKLIGFGEEGTSAIANRPAWALSENIDYLYQRVAADLAIPAGVSFVSAGQSSYHFSASVFCGDSTYPGATGVSDPEGMLMLFAVLDNQYNELTDGAGNEVRVKRVRETTGVTDIYKTGFATNPRVYFHLVDPITGVEVPGSDPYTIPPGIQVRIIFGERGNLESLPTDALTKYKVQTAAEVEAGAFMQDGTRPMTGDADWDSHNLLNLSEARGPAAANLLLHGLKDVELKGDELVTFQDQFLASPVPLGEDGTTAITTPMAPFRPSVLGAVNSATEVNNLLVGNRSLNRTGSFTTTTDPSVVYPDLDLLVNGQTIKVPAGTVAVPPVADYYMLFFNPASAVVEVLDWGGYPNLFPVGSIILWSAEWTGAAWTNIEDLRWPSGKRGEYFSVCVGDGVGADFSDMSQAGRVLAFFINAQKMHFRGEILVVGTATLSETFQMNSGWRLRGLHTDGSRGKIKTTVTFPTTSYLIKSESGTLDTLIEDLEFSWDNSTAHQSTGISAVQVSGTNMTLRRLSFSSSTTFRFANCVSVGGYARVENCTFAGWLESAVIQSAYSSHISMCSFAPDAASYYCVKLSTLPTPNTPNVVEQCRFTAGARYAQIHVGSPCIVRGCYSTQTNGAYNPYFLEMAASSTVQIVAVEMYGNFIDYGNGIKSNLGVAALAQLSARQNTFRSLEDAFLNLTNTASDTASRYTISDNVVHGSGSGSFYLLNATYCRSLSLVRNRFVDIMGGSLSINNDTAFEIVDNYFEGNTLASGSFLTVGNAVNFSSCEIKGNHFGTVGGPTLTNLINIAFNDVLIDSNYFDCSLGDVTNVVTLASAGNVVRGNRFGYGLQHHVKVSSATAHRNRIVHNRFRSGITKTTTIGGQTDVDASSIYVYAGAIGTIIADNNFDTIEGRGIEDRGYGTRIHSNTFESVKGRNIYDAGGGTPSRLKQGVIYTLGAYPLVAQNYLQNTGYAPSASDVTNHCILNEAGGAVIVDNQLLNCIASGGVATNEIFTFIGTYVLCTIKGNIIFKSFYDNDLPRSFLTGIFTGPSANGVVLLGNTVAFSGSCTQTNKPATLGIWPNGERNVVVCNVFPLSWSAGGDSSIGGSLAGDGCSYIGNNSLEEDMFLASIAGAGIMCVGNTIHDSLATMTRGDWPSDTAYNVNANTPSQDLNRVIP